MTNETKVNGYQKQLKQAANIPCKNVFGLTVTCRPWTESLPYKQLIPSNHLQVTATAAEEASFLSTVHSSWLRKHTGNGYHYYR